jgi:hypothetical protein
MKRRELAKEALADDVGDKAAEVDIEGVSVVFNTETRTADITVSTPLASILELENTGLMVMLGELDTIRGYTVNGVTRSFYNEAGERLSNADIKAMILADAFTALDLESCRRAPYEGPGRQEPERAGAWQRRPRRI